MRVYLKISRNFGTYFVILEKIKGQNINFRGKNESWKKYWGKMEFEKNLGAKMS